MNTPTFLTERLLLRKFSKGDLVALYEIYSDIEVNEFLPWFPMKTIEDAVTFYETKLEYGYHQEIAYNYAICLKEDNRPIGYVNVGTGDSYDLGYGLRKEFWHKGIVAEACKVIIEQLETDGIPYITATNDINNPQSGEVMKRLGMSYQYSYQGQWQPKDFLVTFRMYQLNLDGNDGRVYTKYWDVSAVHFVETII